MVRESIRSSCCSQLRTISCLDLDTADESCVVCLCNKHDACVVVVLVHMHIPFAAALHIYVCVVQQTTGSLVQHTFLLQRYICRNNAGVCNHILIVQQNTYFFHKLCNLLFTQHKAGLYNRFGISKNLFSARKLLHSHIRLRLYKECASSEDSTHSTMIC